MGLFFCVITKRSSYDNRCSNEGILLQDDLTAIINAVRDELAGVQPEQKTILNTGGSGRHAAFDP